MSVPVKDAWTLAVAAVGGDSRLAERGALDLESRYAEAHRRYHRTTHVEAVLGHAADLADLEPLNHRDRALLELAVCAHDVVYDARPGYDEHASAAWARSNLAVAGVDDAVVARVEALVMTTLTHEFDPDDRVAAVLSDADLSILGAEAAIYDGYAEAVRAEFAAVTDELWMTGRRRVLEQLLARPRLFVTVAGHARWEDLARENLARELASLAH